MVVNFMIRRISQYVCKQVRTSTLIKKKTTNNKILIFKKYITTTQPHSNTKPLTPMKNYEHSETQTIPSCHNPMLNLNVTKKHDMF
jgi:hypothetical protein